MRTSLPLLTFHAIDDRPSVISFPTQLFQHAVERLWRGGYRTLRLEEAATMLRQREPFPERSVVITFDDGFQSVYDLAFPILRRYHMSATVFLTVGCKATLDPEERLPVWEGRAMLAWNEIREMYREGIDFGAHTLTHPHLPRLTFEEMEKEIRESKNRIETVLNAPVTAFAYPYGRYDFHSREIVRRYFDCACSDRLGLVSMNSDRYALERIDAYYLKTRRLFGLMFNPLFPWYLRARSLPRGVRRALQRS